MNRNWQVSRTNPEYLKYISDKASISHVLAQILVNRGIKDFDSIKAFLSPSLDHVHDPFLLPDMRTAVERVKAAVQRKEKVFVHGDYDADGITSTALLVSVFRGMGVETFYHIPNRITEGYGLSIRGIEKAKACSADLIITVDCGISSKDEVSAAMSMGMDVIVTDHHVPPGDLPCACAVIDPHRTDSVYPYKYLAGVGVAYKLVQAMSLDPFFKIGRSLLNDLLDLVALGTIADSAPLTGENRIFVKYGLEAINKKPCRTGVEALKRISGVTGDVRSGLLSYTLIPRVNAAGRLDDAGDVVELFITGDIEVAERLAHVLDEQNRNRKKIEARVFSDACEMIDPDNLDSAIVLSSPDWHPGVIGIVASRLLEMYFRPVFLFSEKDGVAKGSARSAPPFHLHNAIAGCSDLLIAFGGHSQAAGLKILSGKLPLFRESINRQVEANIDAGALKPVLEIDAAVTLSDINFGLIKELSLLEPFGESNREPLFGAKDISIINHRIVGNNHLKMQLRQNNVNVDTIGFSMGSHLELIGKNRSMDIVFVPSINEWNGSRTLQLNLRAIRPSV